MRITKNAPEFLEFDFNDRGLAKIFHICLLVIIGLTIFGSFLNGALKTSFSDYNYSIGMLVGLVVFLIPFISRVLYKISFDKNAGKIIYFYKSLINREKTNVYEMAEVSQVQLSERINFQTKQQGRSFITYASSKSYDISLLKKSGEAIFFPHMTDCSNCILLRGLDFFRERDGYQEAKNVSSLIAGFLGVPLIDATSKPETTKPANI